MKNIRVFIPLFSIIILVVSSCTVTLLAPYDEVTDKKTVELQETILLQINRWISSYELNPTDTSLKYQNNLEFYNQATTKTELLLSRNEGVEKNRIVVKQLAGLLENINEMDSIHRNDDILNTDDLTAFKTNMSVQLGAIQKFQQVRKESNTN